MSNDKTTSGQGGDALTFKKGDIRAYLSAHSEIARELIDVQNEGWRMTSGDMHFQKQRKQADDADEKTAGVFFKLMKRIGDEMQKKTGVMSLGHTGRLLDLCMAPGGYSASFLKHNPGASVSGASLSEEHGGHKLLISNEHSGANIQVWKGDLTLLAGDIGVMGDDVPHEHPVFGIFQKDEIWGGQQFDLVFCDGQVLRTHTNAMAEHRQRNEARRLICSQLLIALRHLKDGGSMVVLLHSIHNLQTILTLQAFDQFASISLFKPLAGHKSRGSFYLVAKEIRPSCDAALTAIQGWTKSWKDATLRVLIDDEDINMMKDGEDARLAFSEEVKHTMNEYGERLITLGEPIWQIQVQAIKNSPWYKKSKAAESPTLGDFRE